MGQELNKPVGYICGALAGAAFIAGAFFSLGAVTVLIVVRIILVLLGADPCGR